MSTTTQAPFDAAVHTANAWIADLAAELGEACDRHRAYQVMRAVLHALRDHLTPEEAADLAAQLPTLLRGVFYEGWRPAHKPVHERTLGKFMTRVESACPQEFYVSSTHLIRAVFKVLARHVSSGEIDDVKANLPQHIRSLWE